MSISRNLKLGWVVTLALAVSLVGVTSALADDLNPPPWPRLGAPNFSTSAEWDFNDPGEPIFPDGGEVPLIIGDYAPVLDGLLPAGAPHPSASAFNLTWGATADGTGWTGGPGGGFLDFNVPNWVDTEPIKYLWFQVTYTGPQPTFQVFGFFDPTGPHLPAQFIGNTVGSVPGTNKLHLTEEWQIEPNPWWEQISLSVPQGTFIDQVVIDTISTPEPSTMAVLAVGAVAMIKRRKSD